jgi:hypothetical protein
MLATVVVPNYQIHDSYYASSYGPGQTSRYKQLGLTVCTCFQLTEAADKDSGPSRDPTDHRRKLRAVPVTQ